MGIFEKEGIDKGELVKTEKNFSIEIDSPEKLLDERITTKNKIAFGLTGSVVAIFSGIALGSAITFFYNIKLGLSNNLVSLAWLIFAIWNAINDPLFGILEEKTKTSIGRRIPYLRYGAPLFALAFIFCWFPILPSTQSGLFWNLLLDLFLFDSFYTMIGLITYTLPNEMCITQKGRTEISVYNIYFGAIGMLISMLIPMILLTGADTKTLNPLFKPTMIIIAIIGAIIMIWSSYYLIENKYAIHEETLGFIDSIKETFKNKAFLIFEGSNIVYQIAWTILTSMMTYYVQFVMGLSGFDASIPLLITFSMVFLFVIPSQKLSEKYGLKKVYIGSMYMSSLAFLIFFFLSKHPTLVYLGFALAGISLSPIILLGSPIMGDIIDFDETLTGKRRETSYAGMNALVSKPSISIANALFLSVISLYGFDKDKSIQTETAQTGIIIAFTLIPALMLLLSALLMKPFPLDGENWKEQKRKLAEIHLQKEKQYLETIKKKTIEENHKKRT